MLKDYRATILQTTKSYYRYPIKAENLSDAREVAIEEMDKSIIVEENKLPYEDSTWSMILVEQEKD